MGAELEGPGLCPSAGSSGFAQEWWQIAVSQRADLGKEIEKKTCLCEVHSTQGGSAGMSRSTSTAQQGQPGG